MREILISIRPQWVEKILNGEKTIEIRKTEPKCELPVKVYIYCTHGIALYKNPIQLGTDIKKTSGHFKYAPYINGKVVAEFTLNKVKEHKFNYIFENPETYDEELTYNFNCGEMKSAGFDNSWDFDNFLESYGNRKTLYGWHISDLKIYGKPRELGEFRKFCGNNGKGCPDSNCPYYEEPSYEYGEVNHLCDFMKPLTKAPQSWCYVEGVK